MFYICQMKQRSPLVLLLGGNMPDTEKLLQQSERLLSEVFGAAKASSALYASEAWGFYAPDFINQALVYTTHLSPEACLAHTQAVEKALGRTHKTQNQMYHNRPIDIDIIFYGQETVDTDTLQIPHPLMAERQFVLQPLAEILPDFRHPVLDKTITDLLKHCPDTSKVTLLKKQNLPK